MHSQVQYSFTVSPHPKNYDESDIDVIGTFTVDIPADRTIGQFQSDMANKFGFDPPDTFTVLGSFRVLNHELPIGAAELKVGDSVLASGNVVWLFRLDSITPDVGRASGAAKFDLSGFDSERMYEVSEGADSDPE